MFYAEQDIPSQLWYVYNSNRKDKGTFSSYRNKEDAEREAEFLSIHYFWNDKAYRLISRGDN